MTRDNHPSAASLWEQHYRRADSSWGVHPNAVLERVVRTFAPPVGTALDIGCGHGGDALWLARSGWQVTAVDIAPTAVRRVRELAANAGLGNRVTAVVADAAVSLPGGAFDLVCASYFHIAVDRGPVLHAASEHVASGGLLVVVDHASTAPWSWNQDPHVRFPAPQETADTLALGPGWSFEVLETLTRTATGPGSRQAEVTENVVVARRAR